MDIGQIISRSFRITWRYKVLWLFGFLMALTSGGGGNGSNGANSVNYNFPSSRNQNPLGPFSPGQLPSFPVPDQTVWISIALVLCCLLVIYLVLLFYVRFVARGALISGARAANSDTQTKFGALWRAGNKHYARLLGLGLVVNVPLVLISLLLIVLALLPVLPLILSAAQAGQAPNQQAIGQIVASAFGTLALICCVVIVLIVLGLVIHPIYEFAARAIVMDGTGVTEGLSRGWRRFRDNIGNVAVLYLALIGLRIGWGIATLVIAIPAGLIILGAVIAAAASSNATAVVIVALVLGIPLLLVFIFLESLFQTYEAVAWTLGYASLAAAPAIAPTPALQPGAATT